MNVRPQASLRRTACIAATSLLVGACAVGPDFKSPAAPQTDRYTTRPQPAVTESADAPDGQAQALAIGKQLPSRWWTQFGSPQLNELVDQAFVGSPTVASAQATLRQANENYRAQRANLFPFFDLSASAERQKINTSSFGNPGGSSLIYNLFDASVNISYGLDLFGGTRRGVEQQAALAEYQQYELAGTYQTLAANVVTAAIKLAEYRFLVIGQQQIIDSEADVLKVTETRYRVGAIPYSQLLTAQSNLASERSTLIPYRQTLDQTQHQLAIYLGKLPSETAPFDFDLYGFTLPTELPLSLPSNLVRQRPDVRAAEAQLHAASANIGVATADMLPQISLTASLGSEETKLHNLFNSNIWSLGASVAQPLFHAGQLNAKRRAAIAAYDQSRADYRSTVLTAFQNVADTLTALQNDAENLKVQLVAVSTAKQALDLTETQYRLGAASYLDLLTSQQQYTRARAAFVEGQATRLSDTAALFQALGGGALDVDGNVAPIATATTDARPN